MNKVLKSVLIALAGVVAIAAGVAAYVAATFDPNQYKPRLVEAVKEKTGRTLKLDGDIRLSFFPTIGATLGKASLSEAGSEREFAGFDELRVALKLLPLLSKEVVVDTVAVRNLRARIVKAKDGRSNLDDLASGDKKAPASAAKDAGGAPSLKIDIAGVSVENAAVSFVDEAAGATYALSALNLKTGRIAPGVPARIELAARLQGDKPKVDLETALKTTLSFDLEHQHYALAGFEFSAKGLAAGIANLAASAKGEVDAQMAGNEIALTKLELKASGRHEAGDLDLKLAVPKLALSKDKVSGEKIALDAALNGPQRKLAATLTGTLAADLAKQSASFSFNGKLDESTLSGKAGLARFSPPAYQFDLNIDQLDVDRYAPKPAAKGTPEATPKGAAAPAGGGEKPLDLSALKTLTANGSVKIGALKAANVKASNLRVDLKAAGGRLDLNPIAANLYQGALAGAVSVQAAATPAIAVKQTLSGISIGPLLKDAANFDSLEGRGNVSVDISGQGNTVGAIKKALAGSAAIKLTDGALKGINIAATIRDAKAKLGALKGEKTQAASQTEKTDFSELSATFAIKNGVARNNDLAGKSPLLRLAGEGDIDIGNEQLDYLVKATVVATAGGQGGKELSDLAGVTVPVRLTGPFTAPQYKVDFGGIAASAVKATIEKRTGGGNAGQILKGLLGR